eukprot:s706_g16.t1
MGKEVKDNVAAVASPAREEKKKRKTVIKTIVRRKKKSKTSEVPQNGNEADGAYVPPTAEVGDGEDSDVIMTHAESIDKYAQASCQLDAARLEAQPAEEGVEDTVPSTLVDPEPTTPVTPVIEVKESPSKPEQNLECFVEHFEDRQRFPEEETQKPDGEDTNQKPLESHDGEAGIPHVPEQGPVEDDQQNEPENSSHQPEHDDDQQEDPWKTWRDDRSDHSWSHGSWSGGYYNGWAPYHSYYGDYAYHGYHGDYGSYGGYMSHEDYGSYGDYGSDGSGQWTAEEWAAWKTESKCASLRRSSSVDSGFSGLSDLTSISKVQARMNRLDTPDLERYDKNSEWNKDEQMNDKSDAGKDGQGDHAVVPHVAEDAPQSGPSKAADAKADEVAKEESKAPTSEGSEPKDEKPNEDKKGEDDEDRDLDLKSHVAGVPYKQTKKYKAAHARYMKYHRSLSSPSLGHIHILAEHGASIVFLACLSPQASGNWRQSKLYLSVTQTNSQKRVRKRKWLTRKELNEKFGEDVAEILVARKSDPEATGAKEWREHPDLPRVEAGVQELLAT